MAYCCGFDFFVVVGWLAFLFVVSFFLIKVFDIIICYLAWLVHKIKLDYHSFV